MRMFWKMAPTKIAAIVLAFGAVATLPACAQATYGDAYYGNDSPSGYPYDVYADGYYGADAYGYCDAFGCPADYWGLPLYYGSVYFDGAWIGGPLYYRDWGGQRQYWIRGGWHYDGWRGTRPSQYRSWRTGPALGLSWYRDHRVFRRGFNANTYRNNTYRNAGQAPRYGYQGHGNTNGNRYGNTNSNPYGYNGHTINRPENRFRNSFTGQANRGEFTRPPRSNGQNPGANAPWRGNRMGHTGGNGQGNSHQNGGNRGNDHRR